MGDATVTRRTADDLPLAEWLVLALLAEGASYGWPIVRELSADGEIGRIWTVTRANVYRAIDQVVTKGLAIEHGRAPGAGPARSMLRLTPKGRRRVHLWLDSPAAHVRELRSELLCKLVLAVRAGRSIEPLVSRQRDALGAQLAALSKTRPIDVVELWRQEAARAAIRFLDRASAWSPPS